MILRPLVALGYPGGCVQAVLRPPAALNGLGVLSGPLCDAFFYLHAYLSGYFCMFFSFYLHGVFGINLSLHDKKDDIMAISPVYYGYQPSVLWLPTP